MLCSRIYLILLQPSQLSFDKHKQGVSFRFYPVRVFVVKVHFLWAAYNWVLLFLSILTISDFSLGFSFYYFLAMRGMQDISSLTRGQAHVPWGGSGEFKSLDHQGSTLTGLFRPFTFTVIDRVRFQFIILFVFLFSHLFFVTLSSFSAFFWITWEFLIVFYLFCWLINLLIKMINLWFTLYGFNLPQFISSQEQTRPQTQSQSSCQQSCPGRGPPHWGPLCFPLADHTKGLGRSSHHAEPWLAPL